MATIVMADFDFDDCDFERAAVEAAGIRFASFNGKGARTPGDIIEHLHGADGAITSYGRFTAEVFEALPNLKVISKTGTGVDNIDVVAATEAGCAVCNVPDYGTEVVSDHTIALALACLRRINEIDADMRAGVWDFHRHRPLGQVRGRTFGVVGYGNIGRATARKAAGLGFSVVAWDRKHAPGTTTAEGFPYLALEDLLREVDVVSFHTALVPETRHLLNAENIGLMKNDAVVVNTSRGAVIDNDAVAAALCTGKLWGAGIDVFETEPVSPNAPIMGAPRTVLTSHAAYWSEESAAELRLRCTQNAIDVVLGRNPEACVNPEALPRALAK
ncbi:C-terminal binding protein [Adlercreutzia shanghongiae]|uniref:C-terminal binding protein n=1 Tax=Adlercreutzia shanghongiae TaxID=3111773 RepID=A0ABU6IYM4_9ACTN|nr:C-terminal binding protein [Adlercreutzia sp. R22]MEC4294972.1 C-terminal binding protein [Adlercreutzia sp. R22]